MKENNLAIRQVKDIKNHETTQTDESARHEMEYNVNDKNMSREKVLARGAMGAMERERTWPW